MKKALILLCAIGSLALSGTALGQHHGGGHGGGGGHFGGGHFGGGHFGGGHFDGGHHSTFFYGAGFYGYPYGYGYGYGYPYGYGYGYSSGYGYGGYRTVYNGRVVQQQRRLSVEASVQSALASEGYYRGRIDGVIGSGSRSAIRAYQRQNGLPSTGRIDNSLLESLGI